MLIVYETNLGVVVSDKELDGFDIDGDTVFSRKIYDGPITIDSDITVEELKLKYD